MVDSKEVWVAGEVLVDLIPGPNQFTTAVIGGGAANTARACAQLGVQTQFVGGLSTDQYGSLAQAELETSGVRLDYCATFDLPTATAQVMLRDGSAQYQFQLSGSATFAFDSNWLPSGNPQVLHFGTLATLVEPGALELFEWASEVDALRVFDPNVRTSVCSDLVRYRESVAKWAALADVIKLSSEDLETLYLRDGSARNEQEVIETFLNAGAKLVLLTRGSAGISAYTAAKSVETPALPIEVVDTVGAGDAVGAIVVEALSQFGLARLLEDKLEAMLVRAAYAGAITCSRQGAQPPSLNELGLLDLD